jgi:hypothetical protein
MKHTEKLNLTPSDRVRIAQATIQHNHRKHWWNNCESWEIFPTFFSYWEEPEDEEQVDC